MRLLTPRSPLLALCVACLIGFWHVLAVAGPLSLLETDPSRALGEHALQLQESRAQLSLEQAMAEFAAGRFVVARSPILSFGIGARPVWIRLSVTNPTAGPISRRFVVENSWLDRLDVYFVHGRSSVVAHHAGDSLPFNERPQQARFFAFDQEFAAGTTDIYLRIETDDPIVVPMFLLDPQQSAQRSIHQEYSYGFVYGYLLALMGYNMLMFLGLRNKRHLMYAVFIAAFVLTNIAYTGHGYAWLWPENVTLQRWVIPILMVIYGISGLAFAQSFLDTGNHFPRTHRAVSRVSALAALLLGLAIAAGSQFHALIVAFAFVSVFSCAMLFLGALSLHAGHRYSRYFLLASIASMLGTSITALTVWGFIPFSEWKYRAVEFGMLADATLLALALASQIRLIQQEHKIAEQRASSDPLTGLDNRRAFMEKAQQIMSTALRSQRDMSLIILDIDHFKAVNDQHGHVSGDAALVAVANALKLSARNGDIVARWGGEEFLLLLPETRLDAALVMAERLRTTIAEIRVPVRDAQIAFTASFGVAHNAGHRHLENLISEADNHLYQAKHSGRNRVSYAPG
jgi:diguanylate cyclase (GGDEF)-like protein